MLESLLQEKRLYLKETQTLVFYCCEIFKNTYFEEHLGTAVVLGRHMFLIRATVLKLETSLKVADISEFYST